MGIPVFAPYESKNHLVFRKGAYTVRAVPMTDNDGRFVHTNGDGSECPCYGFTIDAVKLGKLLYITDCEFIKWRFNNVKHLLLGVNYSEDVECVDAKRNHVLSGHLSLETAKEFVRVTTERNDLATVILCHLSADADAERFQKEIASVAQCPVYVARPGLTVELRADGCPF